MGEITLILLIFNILLTIWSLRVLSLTVQAGLERLDSQLAGAIQKLVEGDLIGSLEPPNPIQAAIAQMLTQRIQNGPPAAIDVTPRAPDGKFSGE